MNPHSFRTLIGTSLRVTVDGHAWLAAYGQGTSRLTAVTVALVFVAIVAGCQTSSLVSTPDEHYTNFRASELTPGAVMRVAVMPFDNETPHAAAAESLQRAIANELSSRRAFEVIVVPAGQCPLDPIGLAVRGRYPAELLANVRQTYNVDAIVFGRLREFQPYGSPRVGCVAHLVDTELGNVLASVDGSWDARNADVADAARKYVSQMTLPSQLNMHELILVSPDYYNKFVAHQIARTLSAPEEHDDSTLPRMAGMEGAAGAACDTSIRPSYSAGSAKRGLWNKWGRGPQGDRGNESEFSVGQGSAGDGLSRQQDGIPVDQPRYLSGRRGLLSTRR